MQLSFSTSKVVYEYPHLGTFNDEVEALNDCLFVGSQNVISGERKGSFIPSLPPSPSALLSLLFCFMRLPLC